MSMAPDAPTARVAIVLVNWNGWRDTVECLSALFGSDALAQADIWLVDNQSTDGSVEHIQQWCARPTAAADRRRLDGVRYAGTEPVAYQLWQANGQPAPQPAGVQLHIVRSGANLGFAGGNNVGIAAAGLHRYTHFWLLNTDTVIAHDALAPLLARAAAASQVGMVGSTLLFHAQPGTVQALGGGAFDAGAMRMSHLGELKPADQLPRGAAAVMAVEAQMAYVVGASMLVSAAFLRDVGPMCEDYFLYFEELDWAYRARGRYTLGWAPDSRVYHRVGASSAQVQGEFSLNLLYRNQVRFAARFLPERLPALKRKLAGELLGHVLKRRWMPARVVARTLADAARLAAPERRA